MDEHAIDAAAAAGGRPGDDQAGAARSVPLDVLPEAALLIDGDGRVVEASGEGARCVAETLADRVRATTLAPGQPSIALSVSVGVVEFGDEPLPTVEELFATADAAMYADKRRRRKVG